MSIEMGKISDVSKERRLFVGDEIGFDACGPVGLMLRTVEGWGGIGVGALVQRRYHDYVIDAPMAWQYLGGGLVHGVPEAYGMQPRYFDHSVQGSVWMHPSSAAFSFPAAGVRDEEVVVGEGVVVISSSLDMLTNSYLGGIMVSLIFMEGLDEEALVEFMVDWYEEDEDDDRSGEDDLFN
ncbi:hypothetical protein Tco_1554657 [Tanacetum coccineum]